MANKYFAMKEIKRKDLKDLKPGELYRVVTDKGQEYLYQVQEPSPYEPGEEPILSMIPVSIVPVTQKIVTIS